MERILLVEPNYKNKYPPISLMKISTYYKSKGDYVEFHKGLMPKEYVATFDKALITTLFTFDFDICIQTIRYYITILGENNVYVGGIAATIMPERFKGEIPDLQIIVRQLLSSNMLGYNDDINVDSLELDYDILYDIPYRYPMEDSYFVYTSRGCPRQCEFCAVRILEPSFREYSNIKEQIARVDKKFGRKKRLLVMDNNILYATGFCETIKKIVKLGFGRDNNTVKKENHMKYYLRYLRDRVAHDRPYHNLLDRIREELLGIAFRRIKQTDAKIIKELQESIHELKEDRKIAKLLLNNRKYLVNFYSEYNYHKVKRYIDFNQGLDARLLSMNMAVELSKLSLNPCRIAFDDIASKEIYLRAMNNAASCGIKYFSNYILYNYENDSPQDLWERLYANVCFYKEHKDAKIKLFSFPMKYAAIDLTNRDFVGTYWNKKFLQAMNIILNVTSGVVPKEETFFLRAFGSSPQEFIEILYMPDDFIRYRNLFDEKGFTQKWRTLFRRMSSSEKKVLLKLLENQNGKIASINECVSENIKIIWPFYLMKKIRVINNHRG